MSRRRHRWYTGAVLMVVFVALMACGRGQENPPVSAPGTVDPAAPLGTSGNAQRVNFVNGSGCPDGKALSSMHAGSGALTLNYTAMTARTGNGAPPASFRVFCQVSLTVSGRPGQQVAMTGATQTGTVDVPAGIKATVTTAAYPAGQSGTARATEALTGPRTGPVAVTHRFSPAQMVWSPCGQQAMLNLSTSIAVDRGASTAPARVTLNSTTTLALTWRPCTTS